MLRALWDWLFVRRHWTIIKEMTVYREEDGARRAIGILYVLQDQFGNVKKKAMHAGEIHNIV